MAQNEPQTPQYPPTQIDVKIYPPRKNDRSLATASVSLNGCFAIRGVRIVEGSSGPFVSMPSRQVNSGGKTEYRDVCFPCTKEFKREFDQTVLNAYQQHMAQNQAGQEQTGTARDAPGWSGQSAQGPTPWDGPSMNM